MVDATDVPSRLLTSPCWKCGYVSGFPVEGVLSVGQTFRYICVQCEAGNEVIVGEESAAASQMPDAFLTHWCPQCGQPHHGEVDV